MIHSSKHTFRWLLLTGWIIAAGSASIEIVKIPRAQVDWTRVLSATGLLTLTAYVLLLILGLVAFVFYFLGSTTLNSLTQQVSRPRWMRWLAVAVLILSVIWFYLYSPLQDVLNGPWLQLIFSFGLTAWIVMLISPRRQLFGGWEEFIFAVSLFLFPRIVQELRVLFTQAWVYRLAVLFGYLIIIALATILFSSYNQKLIKGLMTFRDRIGWTRWVVIALAFCGPALFYIFAGSKIYTSNPNIRFLFLLIELFLVSVLLNKKSEHLVSAKTVLISVFALALVSVLLTMLLSVTNYPFSMTWSEGDRFYEDSLFFGQHLYNYSGFIVNPYASPGAYLPTSVFFLVPGLSIGLFRLWNVLLSIIPPILIVLILAPKIRNLYIRIGFALWMMLFFILEAPLHPPFMIAAILVFAFMFSESIVVRAVSLAVASFYVGLSRWTWLPVIAGWGILIDLILYYPHRRGPFIRRVAPTLFLALVGLLPGLTTVFIAHPNFGGGANLINNQPLLWYRLLPNPTLPLGILLTAILYSGPLVAVLIWWIVSRRWQLDWLQLLAIGAGLAIFFIGGLVVSSKIGGGGDLHNLDMYLMTLVLIFMLGLYNFLSSDNISVTGWPVWIQIALCLAILLPIYSITPLPRDSAYDPSLGLPSQQVAQQELTDINSHISHSSQQGLVLMMDQRQLLTFNYVSRIPFVPDYEKKYVMDQAMGGNAAYFQNYYQDLAKKRFSLIVTEVLRLRRTTGAFSDENNDWVDWVSKPTLCFYQPLATYDDINVQLLIPRQNISDCQKYLK
ncbi:MAG: hypothetical protein WBW94_02955 [Anaerolineales bacterium]